MAQDEHLVSECLFRGARAGHEVGIGGGRQVTGALHPSLAVQVASLTEDEQAEGGVLRGRSLGAHKAQGYAVRAPIPASPGRRGEAAQRARGHDGMSPVRVLIAPDRYAGLLDAAQAAEAMAGGWTEGAPHDDVPRLGLTDGGPGFDRLDLVAVLKTRD